MHRIALFLAFGLGLVACSHPAPPAKPMECPSVAVAKPEPAPAGLAIRAMDEKAVIAHADAFMHAMDTSDAKAFEAASAPAFTWFLYGRTYDRALLSKRLPLRKE